jgi:hypothetical protein
MVYGLRVLFMGLESWILSLGLWKFSAIIQLLLWLSGSRSKHIDIKYLAIREKVVVIKHISTELIIVDPLTKGMPPLKFKDHAENMGLGSSLWLYTFSLLIKLLYIMVFSHIHARTSVLRKYISCWTKNKHMVYSLSFIVTTLSVYLRN